MGRIRSARRRTAWWTLAAVGAVLLLSSCTLRRVALPEPASDRALATGDLWDGAWLAAMAIGIFVWSLILWVVLRYRRRNEDDVPTQNRYNLPIEVLYTIAPLIVVAVLFYFTLETQSTVTAGAYEATSDLQPSMDPADAAAGAHQIHVVGQQWAWTFIYSDDPALDGETDVYDIGNPEQFTDLYLPLNEPVTFTLTSQDVIHSFFVPEFYFKLDVIPGKQNSFTLTPNRLGTFVGRCSELCGVYHSRMLFDVHIVTPEEYAAHLQDLQAAGQVGEPQGKSYSYTIAGN